MAGFADGLRAGWEKVQATLVTVTDMIVEAGKEISERSAEGFKWSVDKLRPGPDAIERWGKLTQAMHGTVEILQDLERGLKRAWGVIARAEERSQAA